MGDGGRGWRVLDTDHPSSWSGCRRLFPRSGRRRRTHPLCPSMRCTATCPTATSRVICGARPPLRSTFGTRAPLALRRFRRCCSPPSPLAFVRRLRSDACHSCVERTRTVFSQFCITPLTSPISLLSVWDPSASSRPSSCASSSGLVAVRAAPAGPCASAAVPYIASTAPMPTPSTPRCCAALRAFCTLPRGTGRSTGTRTVPGNGRR